MKGLWDQMKYEAGKLPIDRLRDGTMTDDEVRLVAAETVRNSVALCDPARTTFDALADRLMLVRLAEPRQTRARSTYQPEGAVVSAYVETAEPMEGEDWWPWYYAMCGDCGWEGDGYDLDDYAKADADAKAHACRASHSQSRPA